MRSSASMRSVLAHVDEDDNSALEVGFAARIDARAALIAEAGGIITDIRGREVRFNNRNVKLEGLIADNGYLH